MPVVDVDVVVDVVGRAGADLVGAVDSTSLAVGEAEDDGSAAVGRRVAPWSATSRRPMTSKPINPRASTTSSAGARALVGRRCRAPAIGSSATRVPSRSQG
jgi:hypothetical protein